MINQYSRYLSYFFLLIFFSDFFCDLAVLLFVKVKKFGNGKLNSENLKTKLCDPGRFYEVNEAVFETILKLFEAFISFLLRSF